MAEAASLLPNATRDLARFAANLCYDDIPADVRQHVKLCVLDGLGVALFGSRLPWTRMVQDAAIEEGANPVASFWGTPFIGRPMQVT